MFGPAIHCCGQRLHCSLLETWVYAVHLIFLGGNLDSRRVFRCSLLSIVDHHRYLHFPHRGWGAGVERSLSRVLFLSN
jgi:hypothetical protein